MNYTVIYEHEAEIQLDEILDDTGIISVLGYHFTPSEILKNCDPIAYRETLNGYIDGLTEGGVYVYGITDDEKPTDEEIE